MLSSEATYIRGMVEIGKYPPSTLLPSPADAVQSRPDSKNKPQNQQNQQVIQNSTQRTSGKQAPLNVLPANDALERLISRAQDAQSAGQTLERGTILNLVV